MIKRLRDIKYSFLMSGLIYVILIPSIVFCPSLAGAASASLSDFSLESFQKKGQSSGTRNPFAPSTVEEIDPSSFTLNGTVVGPNTALCLITTRILKIGDQLGRSTVESITPGEVRLKSAWGESNLKMISYVTETRMSGDKYEIYFDDANIDDALLALSIAGGYNLIMPDDVSGKVSVIFHQSDLKEAMGSILHVNKLEYAEENGIIRVGSPDAIPVGADRQIAQVQLNYTPATEELGSALTKLMSDKGMVITDLRTNTVTLKDRQMAIEQVMQVLKGLDQKDQQVHIRAKILDASRNFGRDLGIQWGFSRDTRNVQGFTSNRTGNFQVNMPATTPTSSLGILIGNLFRDIQLEAAITAAEEKGELKILSEPSITTLNMQEAKIRSGVTIYFKANSDITIGGTGTSGTAEDSSVTSIETGIELTVTPRIIPDDMIQMKIIAEESEADFSRTVDGIPSIIDNTAETIVVVKNGETLVIGGLVKSRKSKQKRSVPALSYIPILGWLFKAKSVDNDDSELLIFMTPQVVHESTDIQPHPQSAYWEEPEKKEEPPSERVEIPPQRKIDPDRKFRLRMRR